MPGVDLPDVNLWVALSAPDHPHYRRAERYWRVEAAAELAFCRITMLGLVRLTSHLRFMGGEPLDPAQAWEVYAAWRRQAGVQFADEPRGCEALLAEWTARGIITPRLWTDAYLAAFAATAGFRVVTFDRDLLRFDGIEALVLNPQDH